MHFANMSEWLSWINSLHVTDIDLSLERVMEVAKRLRLLNPNCLVVTVAGTNGKGSCVAGLESIYLAMGYRVGAFTSPMLFKHNEQVRIQGLDATDADFCEAFERIDQARGEITLTPFEFNTLAAFSIFSNTHLDIWILEVGLGGRFDAVNAINADVAIVSSISLDHTDWLGETREKIAYEKAGIFRNNKPAVCGDFDPPQTLIDYAHEMGAPLYCQSREFGFEKKGSGWTWWSLKNRFENLPIPTLALQNMATVLMAVELLQDKLPVTLEVIQQALTKVTLPGRIQIFPGSITHIFDVSHNPAAAAFLAVWLRENICEGKTHAVFSMLADKDIVSTLEVIKNVIDEWHIASLPIKRGASLEKLLACFEQSGIASVNSYPAISQAYQSAIHQAHKGDRIVVFGSFHTVAEAKL